MDQSQLVVCMRRSCGFCSGVDVSVCFARQQQAFFTGDAAGKAQVLLITLTMSLLCSSVPVSVTVSQHGQHKAAKRNSAIIRFIIYICAFPAVTCQKGLHSCNWTAVYSTYSTDVGSKCCSLKDTVAPFALSIPVTFLSYIL